jgi:hypothetical protein
MEALKWIEASEIIPGDIKPGEAGTSIVGRPDFQGFILTDLLQASKISVHSCILLK